MNKIEIRNKIDSIDKQISLLLKERFLLAEQIGEYKKQNDLPITCPEREAEVINHVVSIFDENSHKNAVKSIYKSIICECTKLQK